MTTVTDADRLLNKKTTSKEQVRVQPPTSAISTTLPAFTAERGAGCTAPLLPSAMALAVHRACSWYAAPAPKVIRSAANPPHAVAAVSRWYSGLAAWRSG